MQYKVTHQFQRGLEQFDKNFTKEVDARAYIEEKLAQNAAMKIQVVYRLYDFDDVIESWDSATYQPAEKTPPSESAAGGAGKNSEMAFRPTPLQTSPRPKGMPQNWRPKDEDEKK